jgi:hypothetical protein
MRVGVAQRIARTQEAGGRYRFPMGRKNVRYKDRGVLHAGRSSPEDCQEAGGRYRLPTGGQKTCQVQGPGCTSCGPE